MKSALTGHQESYASGTRPSGPHTGSDYDTAPARLDAVEPGLRQFLCMMLGCALYNRSFAQARAEFRNM